MAKKQKITGTLVPLSALSSLRSKKEDQGTIETGMVFLDWLKKTGQNGWVLLPLSEIQLVPGSVTKHVSSPYKGYGIGLDPRYLGNVVKSSKYRHSGLPRIPALPAGRSNDHNQSDPRGAQNDKIEKYNKFIADNSDWICDYALFCALRDFFGTDDWRLWSMDIRKYTPEGIDMWTTKLSSKIEHYKLEQCLLHTAYQELRTKAQKNRISLIGDLPFYVSLASPLVWANQELFKIGREGEFTEVSGILWGHFDRQIWGHPLYKWGGESQLRKIADLWKMRLRYHLALFDIVRIDHVKGFFKYGALDLTNPANDRYELGPGEQILGQLLEYAENIGLNIFVEDSGHYRLDEFIKSANKHSLAGMKIYRFAYNEKTQRLSETYADITNYPENSIVYTTTHDTETLIGYLELLTFEEKQTLSKHAGINYKGDDKMFAAAIRNAIIASPAGTVIIPIQDWLLTTDRINIPGTEKEVGDTNWQYKVGVPIEELPIKF